MHSEDVFSQKKLGVDITGVSKSAIITGVLRSVGKTVAYKNAGNIDTKLGKILKPFAFCYVYLFFDFAHNDNDTQTYFYFYVKNICA